MIKNINLIAKPKEVEYLGEAPWNKKKLKRIMTDLAAGHISEKEASELMKDEKVPQNKPKVKIEGKNTHTRQKSIKSKEVK